MSVRNITLLILFFSGQICSAVDMSYCDEYLKVADSPQYERAIVAKLGNLTGKDIESLKKQVKANPMDGGAVQWTSITSFSVGNKDKDSIQYRSSPTFSGSPDITPDYLNVTVVKGKDDSFSVFTRGKLVTKYEIINDKCVPAVSGAIGSFYPGPCAGLAKLISTPPANKSNPKVCDFKDDSCKALNDQARPILLETGLPDFISDKVKNKNFDVLYLAKQTVDRFCSLKTADGGWDLQYKIVHDNSLWGQSKGSVPDKTVRTVQ